MSEIASKPGNIDEETRQKAVKMIATYLGNVFWLQRTRRYWVYLCFLTENTFGIKSWTEYYTQRYFWFSQRHADEGVLGCITRVVGKWFIFCWCFDCFGTKHFGNYICGCYLFLKLFFLLNIYRLLLLTFIYSTLYFGFLRKW